MVLTVDSLLTNDKQSCCTCVSVPYRAGMADSLSPVWCVCDDIINDMLRTLSDLPSEPVNKSMLGDWKADIRAEM